MIPRIMIVDDDADVRETIRLLVDEWFPDAEVHTFADGGRALAAIHRLHPQLVVTDLAMPFVSGRDFAGTAGQLGTGARFVVVSASPEATLGDLKAANPAVTALIGKPFDPEELQTACRAAMGR